MMVPFQDRARVFQAVVAADRAAARHADALSGSLAGHQFVTIRRTSLLEARAAACRGPPPVCHGALLRQPALAPRTTALDRGLLASRRRAQCAAHAAVGSCGGPQEDMQPTWPPEPAVLAEGVRRVAGRAQDGFAQLGHVPGEELRGRVRIQFVDEYGAEEAGVDGGGLFKDFLERLVRPYTTYPIPGVAPMPASACAAGGHVHSWGFCMACARLRRACAHKHVAACGAACMRGATGAPRGRGKAQGPPTLAGLRRCARASTRAWACSPPRRTSACTRRRPRRPPCRARSSTMSSWAA